MRGNYPDNVNPGEQSMPWNAPDHVVVCDTCGERSTTCEVGAACEDCDTGKYQDIEPEEDPRDEYDPNDRD